MQVSAQRLRGRLGQLKFTETDPGCVVGHGRAGSRVPVFIIVHIYIFHEKMGTIKNRNVMELTEAEDIKKRWQQYTEEL